MKGLERITGVIYRYGNTEGTVNEKITKEKHGNFINREGGIVKIETKDITDLWGWWGINFKKKATQRDWSEQEEESNAIITNGKEQEHFQHDGP